MEGVLEVYRRPTSRAGRRSASTSEASNCSRAPPALPRVRDARVAKTTNTNTTASNILKVFESFRGERYVTASERKTSQDFARIVQHLIDVRSQHAGKIVPVMDNLATHTKKAAFYETFEPGERGGRSRAWRFMTRRGTAVG